MYAGFDLEYLPEIDLIHAWITFESNGRFLLFKNFIIYYKVVGN